MICLVHKPVSTILETFRKFHSYVFYTDNSSISQGRIQNHVNCLIYIKSENMVRESGKNRENYQHNRENLSHSQY